MVPPSQQRELIDYSRPWQAVHAYAMPGVSKLWNRGIVRYYSKIPTAVLFTVTGGATAKVVLCVTHLSGN